MKLNKSRQNFLLLAKFSGKDNVFYVSGYAVDNVNTRLLKVAEGIIVHTTYNLTYYQVQVQKKVRNSVFEAIIALTKLTIYSQGHIV